MQVTQRRLSDDSVVMPDHEGDSSFDALKAQLPLPAPLLAACRAIVQPSSSATPIQAACWRWLFSRAPPDLVAISPTGSGKTLAFLVPALASLLNPASPVAAAAAELGKCHVATDAAGAAASTASAAKAEAEEAMRSTAASSFARALGEGKDKEAARAVARVEAKAAYKAALATAAAAASVAAPSAAAASAPESGLASPAALVLAPTRELCQQTASTCELLLSGLGEARGTITSGCVVGGVDYHRQRAMLVETKPTLLVATPGRLLSLCGVMPASTRARRAAQQQSLPAPPEADEADEADEVAVCSLARVSMLVLDEADRLLDLGFEEDLDHILALLPVGAAPVDVSDEGAPPAAPPAAGAATRRTLMFSATWAPRTRHLAAKFLAASALHLTVGLAELAAAASVVQRFEVMRGKGAPRMKRLCALLEDFVGGGEEARRGEESEDEGAASGSSEEEEEGGEGEDEEEAAGGTASQGEAGAAAPGPRVIVFVVHKQESKSLSRALVERGFASCALHGDLSQRARAASMASFRSGECNVLVATDVASRGLDVAGVSHVINFSLGLSIDAYVHRVGRCGRAGAAGIATSFVVDGDEPLLHDLLALLDRSRAPVPAALRELAEAYAQRAGRAAAAAAAREAAASGSAADVEALEEADGEREMRIANREKQLASHGAKVKAERKQQKPRRGKGR